MGKDTLPDIDTLSHIERSPSLTVKDIHPRGFGQGADCGFLEERRQGRRLKDFCPCPGQFSLINLLVEGPQEIPEHRGIAQGAVAVLTGETESFDNAVKVVSSVAREEQSRETGRAEALRGKSDTLTIKFTAKETIVKAGIVGDEDRPVKKTEHLILNVPEKRRFVDILVSNTCKGLYVIRDSPFRIDKGRIFLHQLAFTDAENSYLDDTVKGRADTGCFYVDD